MNLGDIIQIGDVVNGLFICVKCDKLLPHTADYFPKRDKIKLRGECHDCTKQMNKETYKKHADKQISDKQIARDNNINNVNERSVHAGLIHRMKNGGIKVCDEWLNFDQFLKDVGPRPENGMLFDRVDKTGIFETGNAKWFSVKELNKQQKIRHIEKYRLWNTYIKMIDRCHNPNAPDYDRYGGRGIKVCDRWRFGEKDTGYNCFIEDMGYKPNKSMQLDRTNNDGNYEKSNCKWVTRLENGQNKRNNVKVEYEGEIITISELSRRLKISKNVLYYRHSRGYPLF